MSAELLTLEMVLLSAEVFPEPSQTSNTEVFAKMAKSFPLLTFFAKKLHLRCLPGFWIWIDYKIADQLTKNLKTSQECQIH